MTPPRTWCRAVLTSSTPSILCTEERDHAGPHRGRGQGRSEWARAIELDVDDIAGGELVEVVVEWTGSREPGR